MPLKKPASLPEPLRYLQPFTNALAELPPEELNEDVDASPLEAALRKRVRGFNEEAAEAELAQDRAVLEQWLENQPNHPAHWIRGFLLAPDLATHLKQPAERPPRGPEMHFEAPNGWTVKSVPFRSDLKAGKVIGTIMTIEEWSLEVSQRERGWTLALRQLGQEMANEMADVSFGECRAKKYILRTIKPVSWKEVHYLLRVPGGGVWITLSTTAGVDFNESPLEKTLHTLRLSPQA